MLNTNKGYANPAHHKLANRKLQNIKSFKTVEPVEASSNLNDIDFKDQSMLKFIKEKDQTQPSLTLANLKVRGKLNITI